MRATSSIGSRQIAQSAGILWLVGVAYFVLHNGSRPVSRDIGHGVAGQCGRVFASQVPQIAVGVAGAAVLLVAAACNRVRRPVAVVGGVLFAAWVVAAVVVPGSYAWDCVN